MVMEPSSTIIIRCARLDEYDQIGELTFAAYQDLFDREDLGRYGESMRDVKSRAAKADIVLVAEMYGHGIVGALDYYNDYADALSKPNLEHLEHLEGCAGFRLLAVHPSAQRKGVGRALVRWCVDRARHDGRCSIVLNSGSIMQGAQRLYKALGFEQYPKIEFEFRSDTGKMIQVIGMRLNF
jgi:GNAT superfamily N-acetyltransferase